MPEIKLKPCPFCGGEAEVKQFSSIYNRGYYVVCNTKDCHGNTEPENPYRLKECAIEAWNTRAEEIVHCKDCKYLTHAISQNYDIFYGYGYECGKAIFDGYVNPDDFCSRGERRSDNDR